VLDIWSINIFAVFKVAIMKIEKSYYCRKWNQAVKG